MFGPYAWPFNWFDLWELFDKRLTYMEDSKQLAISLRCVIYHVAQVLGES